MDKAKHRNEDFQAFQTGSDQSETPPAGPLEEPRKARMETQTCLARLPWFQSVALCCPLVAQPPRERANTPTSVLQPQDPSRTPNRILLSFHPDCRSRVTADVIAGKGGGTYFGWGNIGESPAENLIQISFCFKHAEHTKNEGTLF